MRLDGRVRGDGFEVEFVLVYGDVLAGCSGEAGVVGAEEDELWMREVRNWDGKGVVWGAEGGRRSCDLNMCAVMCIFIMMVG